MSEELVVVGIGLEGPASLSPAARACVAGADLLAGAKRQLAYFPEFAGARVVLEGNLPAWIAQLKARDRSKRTVVIATGDPLFFGIGRLLLEAFPKEELRFIPSVSSVALAFSRLKETWNDACIISVHGRPLQALVPALARHERKIAVFTDDQNHPAAIAQLICEKGQAPFYVLWVCENVGSEQERITCWRPADLRSETFASLNVVILLRTEGACVDAAKKIALVGIPESALRHRGEQAGMITKREVRLQALCQLELYAGDVLWDIGAGSGSVSIEAARLSPDLTVYAMEKEEVSLQQLRENLDAFALANVQLIAGEAPECFTGLPDPDAVFLGGNGGRLIAILELATTRLKPGGRLVMSCITLETLSQAWSWLSEQRLNPQATSLQLAHSRALGNMHCLEPDKPIFLLRITKP